MIKSSYSVVGVMSGTSLDGIDIVCASYHFEKRWSFNIYHSETIKYSEEWKSILRQLVKNSNEELLEIDKAYSEYLASTILNFIKRNKIKAIDFIASHGHTALHQPENKLTYQIGNLQLLADALNQKIICDFRVQDVQFGGQGAPLVPIGDRLLFSDFDYCLNLGGFANVSFETNDERIAYDICPVNIVLNKYVSKLGLPFDDKGIIASVGKLNEALLNRLNVIQFYKEKPPKSLGLEWVETHIFPLIDSCRLSTETILRTFVEHVAIQIANVLSLDTRKVLITGGGAYNSFLIERLKHHTKLEIVIPEDELVEYKEALIFGLLGILKERNEINCLKSVTGAKRDHSSGKILIPKMEN